MKKEILSVCMILVMLLASLLNIRYLKNLTDEMSRLVEESVQATETEDWELAEVCAEQAKNRWNSIDGYTHVVLRHSEIDTVSDALYEFVSGVYDRNQAEAKVCAEKVIYHLDSIYKMEQVRFGSVF